MGVYTACTGRSEYAAVDYPEVTVIAGARSGKDSRIATPVVLYEALFGGHEHQLAPGEIGTIACVAQDRPAANILRGYLLGMIERTSWLRSMLDGEPTADEIRFRNRISIACFPCTLRSMRGWSIVAGVLDELGYWRLEGSADSDVEILTSIRRGTANFERSKILKISTPWMRSGVLFEDFRQHHGTDSRDLLVWKAPSGLMNPQLKRSTLERAQRLDGARYEREYSAEFLDDAAGFLKSFWIDSAIKPGTKIRSARPVWSYISVIDQSGLRSDEFTHTIGHMEQDIFVQDYLRPWKATGPAFSDLDGLVHSIADVSRQYGCSGVIGDQSSEAWVGQKFAEHKISFTVSPKNTTECYLAAEVVFATGRVDLLDDQQQARQLKLLEKIQRPGGRSIVSHPRGQHDDCAAALCRAIANIAVTFDITDIALIGERRMFDRNRSWEDQRERRELPEEGSSIARMWDSGELTRRRFWDD